MPDQPGTGPSRRLPEELGGQLPGGLGGALGGGLGGLLGGLAGAGGLEALIEQFRQRGQGDVINSWVGRGENRRIAPNQLEDAGPEAIDELQERTGMPRDNMLAELSKLLPEAVDQFTPDGRVPTQEELSRWA